MANEDKDQRPYDRSEASRPSVDMGDLNQELLKRPSAQESANLSVDFGDLKGELGKGKPTG